MSERDTEYKERLFELFIGYGITFGNGYQVDYPESLIGQASKVLDVSGRENFFKVSSYQDFKKKIDKETVIVTKFFCHIKPTENLHSGSDMGEFKTWKEVKEEMEHWKERL